MSEVVNRNAVVNIFLLVFCFILFFLKFFNLLDCNWEEMGNDEIVKRRTVFKFHLNWEKFTFLTFVSNYIGYPGWFLFGSSGPLVLLFTKVSPLGHELYACSREGYFFDVLSLRQRGASIGQAGRAPKTDQLFTAVVLFLIWTKIFGQYKAPFFFELLTNFLFSMTKVSVNYCFWSYFMENKWILLQSGVATVMDFRHRMWQQFHLFHQR